MATVVHTRGHTTTRSGTDTRADTRVGPRGRGHGHARGFRPSGLVIALTVSIALHLILLAVRFVAPQMLLTRPPDSPLEVILVNARSDDKPVKPTAIAQHDLNGGGDQDKGRATSFLPRAREVSDGEVLKESQSAAERLEAEQRRVIARTTKTESPVAPEAPPKVEATDPAPPTDLTTSMKAIARLEAQIDKDTRDLNARPRRGYIGPTTRGASYALYYSQWKDRVERIGTVNYPEEARGRIYGDLALRVILNADGSIYNDEVEVTRSSGSPVLDRAAKRIVRLGAPYGRFSDELRGQFDIFEIVSTFRFTRGDALEMHGGRP